MILKLVNFCEVDFMGEGEELSLFFFYPGKKTLKYAKLHIVETIPELPLHENSGFT